MERAAETGGRPMLYVVRITTQAGFAPLVEEGLRLLGTDAVSWTDERTGTAWMECFLDSREAAERERATLADRLTEWSEGERWSIEVHALADADWRESWKAFFRPARVSPRLTVAPTWEPVPPPADGRVILMDPGMSFGTGLHFTTRSCLACIDACSLHHPRATMLDLGCGSGILAIAASVLGMRGVTAVDRDPAAVACARANAELNGVGDAVRVLQGAVGEFAPARPFDLVVANLYADILIENAAAIAATLSHAAHARLVVAGILSPDFARVADAFSGEGLTVIERFCDEEWTTGCLERG